MFSLKSKSTAWKSVMLYGLISTMAPAVAHAQTVEECFAERDELQAWIDSRDDQDRYQYARTLLERADLYGSQNDGQKCMEYVNEAKGTARSLGGYEG